MRRQRDARHRVHRHRSEAAAAGIAHGDGVAALYPAHTDGGANQQSVKRQGAEEGRRQAFRLTENVDVRHYLRPLEDESSGWVTMLTWKPAAPSSAVTCAIGSQMVSLSARTYTPFALPNFCRMVAGRSLMFTSSALSLMTPSLVMVTTGISCWLLSLTGRTLGTSTSMPNSRTCAVSMKMMSSTRTTSTNGVTLISERAGLPRRLARYPPPLVEKAMGYSPKLRSAILRNSSEKSSMRAPSSRIRWPK